MVTAPAADGDAEQLWGRIRGSHPRFCKAVLADARIALRHRGEPSEPGSTIENAVRIARLAWVSDAFLAQLLYRAKARLQVLRIPILPRIAHHLAIIIAQVSIGDPVVMREGVYIMHGQVVVDGLVQIGAGVVIAPFVTAGCELGTSAAR